MLRVLSSKLIVKSLDEFNAYGYWSEDDDKKLVELYNSGADINTIMSVFKRNKGGIVARLKKLTE